jgi:hypothetical protein
MIMVPSNKFAGHLDFAGFYFSKCPAKFVIRYQLQASIFNSGQFRDKKSLDLHEKSLDLSNYEIFPHKILKSRTFKKSGILIVIIGKASRTRGLVRITVLIQKG